MLKLSGAKTRAVGSCPAPNFLVKNKRAVRNRASGRCQNKHPKEVDTPAKRPTQHKRVPPSPRQSDDINNTTVMVSKSYLDLLLKRSVRQAQSELVVSAPEDVHKSSAEKPLGGTASPFQISFVSHAGPSSVLPRAAHPSGVLPRAAHPSSVLTSAAHPSSVLTSAAHPSSVLPRAAHPSSVLPRTAHPSSVLSSAANPSSVLPHVTNSSSHATADNDSYFPFGRPGCGAPLRSDSGQVVADLRQRVRDGKGVTEVAHARAHVQCVEQEVNQVKFPVATTSPRYARGAGPHVSDYALREKEDKRKKELEHAEFLRAQISAKEQAKQQKKEEAEREERLEEARLMVERQRLKEAFEKESEKVRKKEEESILRQAILQKAIDDAANEAREARNQARGHNYNRVCDHVMERKHHSSQRELEKSKAHNAQQIVTFNLDVADELGQDALGSMPSSKHKKRGSKIPVRRKTIADNAAIVKDRQPTKGGQESSHLALRKHTTEHKLSPSPMGVDQQRMSSPPVPAVAKKLRQQGLLHAQERPLPPAREHSTTQRAAHVETLPPIVFQSPALRRQNESVDCVHTNRKKDALSVRLPSLVTPETNEAERHGALKQLSKLRKVLMSHRSSVDDILTSLLH